MIFKNSHKILSVIIPTRNRHIYLFETVKEIRKRYKNVEIIISDNSDCCLEEKAIQMLEIDCDAIYYHTQELLSVVHNFERSVQYASCDYVTMIGDDDLLGPNIDRVIDYMRECECEAAYPWTSKYVAYFFWPGIDAKKGRLYLNQFSGDFVEIDCQSSIEMALQFPGKGPSDLPKIYQGIVSRDLINRTKESYGHIFGGVSPDIYSGILLAMLCKKLCKIDYPFIIPGGSAESTAGEGRQKRDRESKKENREHISRFGSDLDWPKFVPDVYSSHTVWAQSLYCATKTIGIDFEKINFSFLYLEMFLRHRKFKEQILQSLIAYNHSKFNVLKFLIEASWSAFKYYLPRLIKRLSFFRKNESEVFEFTEISQIYDFVLQKGNVIKAKSA